MMLETMVIVRLLIEDMMVVAGEMIMKMLGIMSYANIVDHGDGDYDNSDGVMMMVMTVVMMG